MLKTDLEAGYSPEPRISHLLITAGQCFYLLAL